MNADFKDMLVRIARWPREDQEELAQIALEIESRRAGPYRATQEELVAIDEGLVAVEVGEISTETGVQALLAKYRRA